LPCNRTFKIPHQHNFFKGEGYNWTFENSTQNHSVIVSSKGYTIKTIGFGLDATIFCLHNVVEIFNNRRLRMSTVNFSVPQDVKDAFNSAFKGQNKSAVIAHLMQEAVEKMQRQLAHCDAVNRIFINRLSAPNITESQFMAAREESRG
jgi:hypothetical protein